MRDSLLLGGRDFCGADIEMAIDLRGIADEDFAVEFFGEGDGQRGFSGGCGAEDDGEARGLCSHFN